MSLSDNLWKLTKGAAQATGIPYFISADIINPIKESAAILTNNKQAQQNVARQQQQLLTPQRFAGNTASALLPFAGGPIAGQIGKFTQNRLLADALLGASLGAPMNVAGQFGTGQDVNVPQAALQGAAFGGALGAAVPAAAGLRNLNQAGGVKQPDFDVIERLWGDYFKGKPAVQGSGLSGEGAMAPKSLSDAIKKQLMERMREGAKNQGGFIQFPYGRKQVISRSPLESKELSGLVKSGKLYDKAQVVNIDRLKLGGGTWSPDSIDANALNRYKSAILNDRTIDPLVVRNSQGRLFVEDGRHRLQAMRDLGITDVPIVLQK